MKILFLGYAVNPREAAKLSGISIAGNKMQANLLATLVKNPDIQLDSVTVYPIASFPRDKKLYVLDEVIHINDGITSHRVRFCNLPFIKQLSQTLSVYRKAWSLVDADTVVFTFNSFLQVGIPALWLKRKKGCTVCSLLADLPIDDNPGSRNIVRNFFSKAFEKITAYAIKQADLLVVLNSQAVSEYAPGKRFIVVEGGVIPEQIPQIDNYKTVDRKNIVYGGALTEYSGVLDLIEAMKYVKNPDVTLDIYGGGYIEDKVRQLAKASDNVSYHGRVSNAQMLQIQRTAFLLANPRPINDPIARVTFPSKLFEYMVSGTPVLTTKLNGLSDEFLQNVYAIEDTKPETFAAMIDHIASLSMDELNEKAKSAFTFIMQEKNWEKQCAKIYSFIKGNLEENHA